MKILHITTSYLPTMAGAEFVVKNLYEKQRSSGHDVKLLVPFTFYRLSDKKNIYSMPPYLGKLAFKFPKIASYYSYIYLLLLRKKFKFDVVHCHFIFPTGLYVEKLLKKHKIKAIVTPHGVDIQKYNLDSNKINGINENIYIPKIQNISKSFNKIIALSNDMENCLINTYSIDKNKIIKIPNGVECENFNLIKKSKKSSKKIILTVGRNHPKKGFDLIPLIIQYLLKNKIDNFHWVLIGGGCSKIDNLLDDNTRKYITIHETIGSISDDSFPSDMLIQYYKNADIFCFPTYIESFGIVIIEAMAGKCAIVATKTTGVLDIIENKKNGLLTNIGDPDDIGSKLIKLLNDENLIHKYSNMAYKDALKYDWKIVSNKHIELYKSIEK